MWDQRNIKFLLSLLKAAIHNETYDADVTGVDWHQVYRLGARNNILPLLYKQVQKISENNELPGALLEEWKKYTLISMMKEVQKYSILRKILSLAGEQDITLVILKGCVLAELYPDYLARASCDSDIYVYERDKEKVVRLFEGMGFRKSNISSKDSVYNYLLDDIHYKVEVHFSLWEDYKGPKIELLESLRLTDEKSLIRLKACGFNITTLGYEEHLIFQIFHIIKHFSLQGAGIRHLTDIALYVNRYGDHINFNYFWRKMRVLNYDRFCDNLFYICSHYFGMDTGIMNSRKVKVIPDIETFLADLLNIGPCYEQKTANWHLVGILEPYFLGEQTIPRTRLSRKLKILFPERKVFPIEYAKKHPLLLPIGWIHRCLHFVARLPRRRKELTDAKEKMQLSEIRLSLMHDLGLTEGGKR